MTIKVPPARYLESYAGHKVVQVNREDLEDWDKALTAQVTRLEKGWRNCYRVCLEKDKALGFLLHELRTSTQATRDKAWKENLLAAVEENAALIPEEPPALAEVKGQGQGGTGQ